MTLVWKHLIELVGFLIILIAPNPTGQLAHLEEAQLIKRFANHQFSVQRSNHLLELRHNGIKFLLLQKRLTSFSWIKPAWRSIGRNNPNTQHCKCSVSSTSFSICTCTVYPGRPEENYETLHRLVFPEKLLEKATRRPAEGTISRPLLWEVTYKMLPLLLTMQELFRYRWRHWVKPHPICHFFSLWRISFHWHQYKCRGYIGPLPWIDFKAFLQKNLSDSWVFIDTTWSRIKRDSQFQQEEL